MSKVNVLVVDDASFIRDLVKKSLRDNFPGMQIEEAVNGRKAQFALAKQAFDLILCDWEMPEMSGLELLTWCRGHASYKSIPFIMVTSRGDKENVVQAIQAGVSDYIGKPFTNEQLYTRVKKALTRTGRIQALMQSGVQPMNKAFANDSLAALTSRQPKREPEVSSASVSATAPQVAQGALPPASPPRTPTQGRGQAQLRIAGGVQLCVIKSLSLKEAILVTKRASQLPQVLESAVLDLEQGEGGEVARLNGYLHSVAAFELKPDSEWLQLHFRFVDQDAQKLEYLSRLIARGSTQKHFVPGA